MENVAKEGNYILKDFNKNKEGLSDKHSILCIVYVDREGAEHESFLIWRSGKTMKSRSLGSTRGDYSVQGIVDFAKLMTKADEILFERKF